MVLIYVHRIHSKMVHKSLKHGHSIRLSNMYCVFPFQLILHTLRFYIYGFNQQKIFEDQKKSCILNIRGLFPFDRSFLKYVMCTDIASFLLGIMTSRVDTRYLKHVALLWRYLMILHREHECEQYYFNESSGTNSQRVLGVTVHAYL